MEQKNNFFLNKNANNPNKVNQSDKVSIICKKTCLFTNARDEKHILEWAAHHLLIGFNRIIIFDHKSEKPLKKVFKNFDKRVNIVNVSYLENPIKMALMNKAAEIAAKLKIDWMIYLDADEFIILNKKYRGIKHFLSIYNHADSLAINWLMFGSNYLEKDPDGLIVENYTKSDLFLNDHVKSFVRPNRVIDATNPHYYNMIDKLRYFNINNQILKDNYHSNILNIEFYKVPIYIAHYVYQSEETFLKRKVILPRDDNGEHRRFDSDDDNKAKFIHNYHNIHENLYPKNKYAEGIQNFLQQYSKSNTT